MPKTILIADDSTSIRSIFKMSLEFKGYRIIEAEDGSKAWEILQSEPCDLLISDLAMPGMTGLELLQKVRAEHPNKALPVIICTAERVKTEDIISRGADKLLPKPCSPVELMRVVEALL